MIQKKMESRWERIVEQIYEQNEEFDYKQTKALVKEINSYIFVLKKQKQEVKTTLRITDFNNQEVLKAELEEFVQYASDQEEFIEQFAMLEPKSKKGYYNYIKNVMGYL